MFVSQVSGRANGDPPATKMTRSTERTGMITAPKAGIEEKALNLLAHSTNKVKSVLSFQELKIKKKAFHLTKR